MDEKGQLIHSSIEDRLIATSTGKLSELNNVIGVAAGRVKAEAILAVLKGRILDTLITDTDTAEAILAVDHQL